MNRAERFLFAGSIVGIMTIESDVPIALSNVSINHCVATERVIPDMPLFSDVPLTIIDRGRILTAGRGPFYIDPMTRELYSSPGRVPKSPQDCSPR